MYVEVLTLYKVTIEKNVTSAMLSSDFLCVLCASVVKN